MILVKKKIDPPPPPPNELGNCSSTLALVIFSDPPLPWGSSV